MAGDLVANVRYSPNCGAEADTEVGPDRVKSGHSSDRPLCANALNRCAIARYAGSPTASTVAGVKIVDSARVALS